MLQKAKIRIQNIKSENDKILLETAMDILEGVKDFTVNEKTGEALIELDDEVINLDKKILKIIEKLGFKFQKGQILPIQKEYTYFVKGMHCASCEILIEKKLLKLPNVKSVDASVNQGRVKIIFEKERPSIKKLNQLFKKEGYFFLDEPTKEKGGNHILTIVGSALLVIILFFLLKNSTFAGLVNVNANSSLPTFFLLGLIAGVSSCAALVGGLLLSMAKQWLETYSKSNSIFLKLQPHLMFNFGRILSYTILGGLIGAVGVKLQISLGFTVFLIGAVSLLMIFLGLQMLGVRAFSRFQIVMPKFITRYIANETRFQGKYMPLLVGAFTFFLPCGFTLTSQGLALISGSFFQGALIMMFFALGTTPGLLAIGFSSVKFLEKPHLSDKFLKVAGILVLFFALYNINGQLNLFGLASLSDVKLDFFNTQTSSRDNLKNEGGLAPIINRKQVIKMEALSYGYEPNYFKIRVGMPVRWEITDKGTSGCTNAIVSRSLFEGEINLTPGQTSIKEFTPEKAAKYKFSCWMGMVSGVIEVVDKDGFLSENTNNTDKDEEDFIPSGVEGGCSCGCGGY